MTSVGIVPVTPAELTKVVGLTHEFDFVGKTGTFEVYSIGGKPLVETDTYRLAVAKNSSGQLGLAMISASEDTNESVDRQVRILSTLQKIGEDLDDEAKKGENVSPFYGAMLPVVLEAFETDDKRTGVFLGYHESISTYKQLVPLSVATNSVRVDLKTCVWLLGKPLKLVDFVHNLGFTIGRIDPSNLLLETSVHGTIFLDFTSANENPSADECLAEVATLAKMVWNAAGGTDDADPPYDAGIMNPAQHGKFVAFLRRIKNGETKGAGDEHTALYELADEIWPREEKNDEFGKVQKRPFHIWVTYSR